MVTLPILGAAAAQLAAIHQAATGQPELLALSFTDAAQTSQTYEAYQRAIAARPTPELVYLGVALAGPVEQALLANPARRQDHDRGAARET